jgi:GxxExxY protein
MKVRLTKKEVTQLSYEIVGYAIKVHKKLGPGLLESVYEECLKYELEKNGYDVKQQLLIKIEYDELELESQLRLDLLVNDCVVVELKTVDNFHPIHEAKILTYMNLLKRPQGLLINFNTTKITKSTKPFVNEYFQMLEDE